MRAQGAGASGGGLVVFPWGQWASKGRKAEGQAATRSRKQRRCGAQLAAAIESRRGCGGGRCQRVAAIVSRAHEAQGS